MPTALYNFSINLTASQIQRNSLQRKTHVTQLKLNKAAPKTDAVLYRAKNTQMEATRLRFSLQPSCHPAAVPWLIYLVFSGYTFLPLQNEKVQINSPGPILIFCNYIP